jgi:hypothetical protein
MTCPSRNNLQGWSLIVAAMWAFMSGSAKGDMASLGVTGPHSGTGFANLGAVTKEPVRTTMTNAEILIEIQGRKGDDLTAACTAVFDLDTEPNLESKSQTVLVAFPVTGFTGEAVTISQFEVTIDGVQKPEVYGRPIHLFSEKEDSADIWGGLPKEWLPVKTSQVDLEYFGFQLNRGDLITNTLLQAFAWTQEFLPGKHCRVEVKYLLTLHAQSLAYAKKYMRGQSRDLVPFEAMVAGESSEKAFFLDYILRSGATWKGPIGHEIVTLRAAPSSGLVLDRGEVITFDRRIFPAPRYTPESIERLRVGVSAERINWKKEDVVWEIDHEKPKEDILVQIPFSAIKSRSDAKKP